MADLEAAIQALTLEATKQGDSVRALKANKAEKSVITEEVEKLKNVKAELAQLVKKQAEQQTAAGGGGKANKETFRKHLSSTLEHNMFYMPSFKIYGGVGGLYDYGPTGAAIKANLQAFWRQHFVLEENMLEVCGNPDRNETATIVQACEGSTIRFHKVQIHTIVVFSH
eukprot:3981930-Pyramimonas_sp.AAC.1